jgi:hypothetical protein
VARASRIWDGLVTFVPQVPQGQTTVSGKAIQLGSGSADVAATHTGNTYSTDITTNGVGTNNVVIGHTLPRGTNPAAVVLDGKRVNNYKVVSTNRGNEVMIPTSAGHHTLTITV